LKIQSGFIATLEACFRDRFGEAGEVQFALAPGRVNLVGEHTDYNDGWVLPMAIERHVGVFEESLELDLAAPEVPVPRGWMTYVAGMAWMMARAGSQVSGIDCVIDGDVPLGSGLSSSAALEMATARALCAASELTWSPRDMARLGQRAEHEFVGVNCGLMDQMASALAESGCAMLLDCRSMTTEKVPIPEDARVVVMDTGVRRSLAGSEYNDRRASCEAAVEVAKRLNPEVKALRDVDTALLESARSGLDELTYRRAKHVVEENARPAAMAAALRDGDLVEAGRLMNESHRSLRQLYEVSSAELDLVTDLARSHSTCFGARLTGAGFGGCAVALVDAEGAGGFIFDVHSAYRAEVDLSSEFFGCRPAAGAHIVQRADAAAEAVVAFLEE
jgi:galactokinase